nr:cysteine desulfurase family protein [Mesorhizobium sp.]
MAARRTYLDHNASAPLSDGARAAMVDALAIDANPSSVHTEGRDARRVVETARREVAALANGDPANVVFTSGATEAASWLLTPNWRMGRAPLNVSRLIVSAADHPATLNGGHFSPDRVTRLSVDADGVLRLDELASELASHDRSAGQVLVAIHFANNETGVVQPVAKIAAMVREAGGILVLDAVQAAGRIALDISDGCADFLILSSHKIGGPKGAGAVVSAGGVLMPEPLIRGGGQEHGHRAGTENVAAIAGFGAAAHEAKARLSNSPDIARLRDRFEAAIVDLVPGAVIFGRVAPRLPNTTYFAIPGIKAETAQIAFDLEGVALSAGSACSSGKVGPSHVLAAMGHGAYGGALRVSIGHQTSDEDLAAFVGALRKLIARRAVKAA